LHGRRTRAIASWQRAVTESERLVIPFNTVRAYLEIARHTPPGSAERRVSCDAARAIAERIGAAGELARISALGC
jgi:hypothetical protein